MQEFISEDDLQTFEGWLRYQTVDASTQTPEELAMWRGVFEESRQRGATHPKVGLMKLKPLDPGEYRYAVALREGADLWLTLWVRRSPKGEFFIMRPGDPDRDLHVSYHLDGTSYPKSDGRVVGRPHKRQPLTGTFRGSEPLFVWSGHVPKFVGAICDPEAFSGVVEVGPGVLGPRDGAVAVDLVEPGQDVPEVPWTRIVKREVFRDIVPWVVITVGAFEAPAQEREQ